MANRNKWWYSWRTEINGGIHDKQTKLAHEPKTVVFKATWQVFPAHGQKPVRRLLFREENK